MSIRWSKTVKSSPRYLDLAPPAPFAAATDARHGPYGGSALVQAHVAFAGEF